jgi:hypothetical protein
MNPWCLTASSWQVTDGIQCTPINTSPECQFSFSWFDHGTCVPYLGSFRPVTFQQLWVYFLQLF